MASNEFGYIREKVKMAIKQELRKTVSASLEKNSKDLAIQIQKISEGISEWIWDKLIFEEIRQASLNSMASSDMVITTIIDKVYKDALNNVAPKIDEAVSTIRTMIIQATGDAIRELLQEETEKMITKRKKQEQ